jgi:hypothetical protein
MILAEDVFGDERVVVVPVMRVQMDVMAAFGYRM